MKKPAIRFCILIVHLLIGMFLLSPQPSYSATIDPKFKFSTKETEHFVIHYHQWLDGIADKAASISEDMHNKLSSTFQWSPAEKTQIVLLDNMDFANGMATVLPYNAMYIFVVPPLPDMTIGEYDDWLRLVLIHEYAHILTMDPSRGYSSVTRKIFGKTIPGYDPLSLLVFLLTTPPNVFMPDWWLEGIAAWAETEFTSAGRGRSAYVEMVLRMSVLENAVPTVDKLNGDVPYWPSGSIPYIYGMMLEKYIAERYGREALGKLSIAHSGRAPFFIDAPPEENTGHDYAKLYRQMVQELRAAQTEKIEALKSRPLTEYRTAPIKGELLTNPRVSPDGLFLAINRRDPHFHEEIVILDAGTFEEISTVRRFPSDHSLSWSPDSRKLYFTQAELKNSYNLYQDIYSFNLGDHSVERITKNIRAKDIDMSPDGERIVFVKVETGRQNIATLSVKDKKLNVIIKLEDTALSNPRWSPDGRHVVFARHDNSGQNSIEHLDVELETSEALFKDGFYNVYPAWSPDGKNIIFTSSRTGVYNLFAYSLSEKKIYQMTHVIGGAFQPEVSQGGNIFYSGYNSKGFFIAEMPYDTSKWTEELSPVILPSWKNNDSGEPVYSAQNGLSAEAFPLSVSEKRDYSPVKTLLPKFWLPTLSTDHDGPVFGAFTAGQDVLGYHTYLAQGGIGAGSEKYFDITYVYDRWYPTLFLKWRSLPVFYSEFFNVDEDYYERQSSLTAGAIVPIPLNTLESRYSLTAGFNYLRLRELDEINNRTVNGLEVFEGKRNNVFIGFLYSGALRYPYSISREEGRNISFIYRDYSERLGSNLNQKEYAGDYKEYIRMRPGKNDVVFFNLKGAASSGEQIAQQAFHIGGPPFQGNEYSLRGFSSGFQTGKYVLTGTLEYRAPLKYIFSGPGTSPIFLDRLHLAVFTDAGNVWGNDKGFRMSDLSVGVGVEQRIDMIVGYKLKVTPAVGIARGITDNGETQIYLTIYVEL